MDYQPQDITILVVEDNQGHLEILLNILTDLDYRLIAANTGEKALKICNKITPDLILMDVQMPGMDGYETARQLLDTPATCHIPILFTSTLSDSQSILRCFESGGVDYISKPFKKEELLARINTHITLKQLREQFQTDRDHLFSILQNILPENLLNILKQGSIPKPEQTDNAAVLFTDFQNFSTLARILGSEQSVEHLNKIYYVFDEIVDVFGLERVKTIGDAYFAVGGVNTHPENIYLSPLLAALKMQEFVTYYNSFMDDIRWELRIGFMIGPVTSGIIGYQKIAYDVWGDTVNLANRLEKEAEAGHVAITDSVYQKIRNYILVARNDLMHSTSWGTMNIYHCHKITDNLPKKELEKIQSIDLEYLLNQAINKRSLLKKIFPLTEDHRRQL